MIYNGIPVCIGFKLEGLPAETVGFHLFRVERLHVPYQLIHLCVYVWLRLTVAREEIDQPHLIHGACHPAIKMDIHPHRL